MKIRKTRGHGFRQILKIAVRSTLRNLRQTVLIVLIIAAPLAVGSTILTIEESRELTPSERIEFELGGAQARFSPQRPVSLEQASDPSLQTLYQMPDREEVLGASVEATTKEQLELRDPRALDLIKGIWISSLESSVILETSTGIGSMLLVEGEVWRLDSKHKLLEGRFPQSENEILLSPAALARVGGTVGDEVKFINADPKVVVGVLDSLPSVDSASIVFALPAAISGVTPEGNLAETKFYLLGESSVPWNKVLEFNRFGIGVLSAEVLKTPPQKEVIPTVLDSLLLVDSQEVIFSAILVFSLFFVLAIPIAVLSGAAFAFGARRQERTLALMSSLGASPKQLRQVTTLSAILLGILGGTLGIVVGLGLAAFILPLQSEGSRLLYPGFHIPLFDLLLLLGLSTLTAYLVSLIPARNAANVDVVSTLRGKRLGMPVSRKAKTGSLILILLGVGIVTFASFASTSTSATAPTAMSAGFLAWLAIQSYFLGIVLLIVGLLIGSGWLLDLFRLLTATGGVAVKFAARDILFNRKRYQAVIAAVLAASFLGSSILVFAYGMLQNEAQRYKAKLPVDQVLVDPKPSMPELVNPIGILGEDQEFFEGAIERANGGLEQKLNVLLGAAEVENYALINQFLPLSYLGFGTDPNTFAPELGAEGLQPLLRTTPESTCPWNPAHPEHEDYLALEESGGWEAALEFSRNPEFEDCDRSNWVRDRLFIGDAADLEVLLGERPPAAAISILENGGAVVFKGDFYSDGEAILDWFPSSALGYLSQPVDDYFDQNSPEPQLPKLTKSVQLPAILVETPYSDATIMISQRTASELQIEPRFKLLIANFPEELSIQQRDFLNAEIGGYLVEEGFSPNPQDIGWLIVLIAAAFILAASSIALSLVQIESRPDLSTLAAIGAPRAFRARVVSLQALFLTGIGAMAGAIVGILLGANLLGLLLVTEPQFPILQLGFLTLATPMMIGALTYWVTPKTIPFIGRNALD